MNTYRGRPAGGGTSYHPLPSSSIVSFFLIWCSHINQDILYYNDTGQWDE